MCITLFLTFVAQPAANRIRVNFRLPMAAAMCSAVSPFCRAQTQVKGFGLRYFRPFFIFETMSRQFPTTYWDRRRYLVLLRDVTLGANEDAHDSRVTVAPAGVQRSIAIL